MLRSFKGVKKGGLLNLIIKVISINVIFKNYKGTVVTKRQRKRLYQRAMNS